MNIVLLLLSKNIAVDGSMSWAHLFILWKKYLKNSIINSSLKLDWYCVIILYFVYCVSGGERLTLIGNKQ